MKEKILKHKKLLIICGSILMILIILILVLVFALTKRKEISNPEISNRQRRNTIVSDTIELEGTVSVGTKSQSFTLDIASFSGQSFEWNSSGMFNGTDGMGAVGGGVMGNMTFVVSGSSDSSDARQLTVEEVYVQVGQQINAGDPVLKASQSSISKLRNDFEADVDEAQNVYDQALTSQQQCESEAALTQAENELYGIYADTEYEVSVQKLTESIDAIQESIESANEEIAALQEEIVTLQAAAAQHQTALNNAVYARDSEKAIDNPYGWLTADTTRINLENLIETANETIETDYEQIDTLLDEIESLNLQLRQAEYELEKGKIEAESAKKIRAVKAENAQEIYDVSVSLAEFTTQNALEDYEEAKEKLDALDNYLPDGILYADKDGVVTSVSVSAGDNLSQNMELISVNNYEDVTITLSVDETDMEAAALGSKAEIAFAAYQGEIFYGEVTGVGDAEMDSDTNTTVYQVEITIDTDEGSKLYEGMTAVVTLTRPVNKGRGGNR